MILPMLGDGRLHLSGIAQLAPHITRENRETLLRRATHRSKRQIEELIAEVAPREDVPALMRRLPERGTAPAATQPTPSGMGRTVTLSLVHSRRSAGLAPVSTSPELRRLFLGVQGQFTPARLTRSSSGFGLSCARRSTAISARSSKRPSPRNSSASRPAGSRDEPSRRSLSKTDTSPPRDTSRRPSGERCASVTGTDAATSTRQGGGATGGTVSSTTTFTPSAWEETTGPRTSTCVPSAQPLPGRARLRSGSDGSIPPTRKRVGGASRSVRHGPERSGSSGCGAAPGRGTVRFLITGSSGPRAGRRIGAWPRWDRNLALAGQCACILCAVRNDEATASAAGDARPRRAGPSPARTRAGGSDRRTAWGRACTRRGVGRPSRRRRPPPSAGSRG